jgi:hypothetical protein
MKPKPSDDQFSEKEAKQRFEAALRSAINTPHKPLSISRSEEGSEEEAARTIDALYHLLRLNTIDNALDNRRVDTQQRGYPQHADAVAVAVQCPDLGFDRWRDRTRRA